MRNLTLLSGALLVLALAASPSTLHAADSMRCGSRLVSTEDLAEKVLGACGQPDFIDRWEPPASILPLAALAGVEEWYYNFGSSQLLRVLHFQHGRLTQIETDGYGFSDSRARGCSPYQIVEGLSKYRLQSACGEPATRRIEYSYRPLRHRHAHGRSTATESVGVFPVYCEEWVYNFGARDLLRVVTLENGRVADVQTEGRGYDATR